MSMQAVKGEDFEGQQSLLQVFDKIGNLIKNAEDIRVERLKAQETVVAATSALQDTFSMLLDHTSTISERLKKALKDCDSLSKELSSLANENSQLLRKVDLLTEDKRNLELKISMSEKSDTE